MAEMPVCKTRLTKRLNPRNATVCDNKLKRKLPVSFFQLILIYIQSGHDFIDFLPGTVQSFPGLEEKQ